MTGTSPSPVPLSFSHIGLFVLDLDRMVLFYRDVLGFIVTDRGHLPNGELCFLSRDPREHHQIVLVSGRPEGLPDRIVNQVSHAFNEVDLRRGGTTIAVNGAVSTTGSASR